MYIVICKGLTSDNIWSKDLLSFHTTHSGDSAGVDLTMDAIIDMAEC